MSAAVADILRRAKARRTIRYLDSDPIPLRDSIGAAIALAIVVYAIVAGGL